MKEIIGPILAPLETIKNLQGFTYRGNALAGEFGFDTTLVQSGLSAQKLKDNVPGSTFPAPFDIDVVDGVDVSKSGQQYLTAQYDKTIPLLVECIKELIARVEELEK